MVRARRLQAILEQRCPVCLAGPMFSGLIEMNDRCPVCGHRFMREPGFFQGAMYVSYVLAMAQLLVLALLANRWIAPHLGRTAAWAAAVIAQLLLVPVLYRYSRVVWAHLNVATGARSEEPDDRAL